MRWLALLPVAVFAFLGGLFLKGMWRDDPDTLPSVRVGQPAPTLTVTALPGRTPLTPNMLTDGNVKLVNFWASWCVPCRVEHPQLETLSGTLPVYGVNYKDAPSDALRFLEELGDPYAAIGADATARTGLDWGVYGLPETFVVDGEGIVTYRFVGPITQSVVTDTLLPEIEKARTP
ncbi:DsbE family thiol:disulfide interchange protein [Jannaschia sp. S6380]|uniref:DsbE family thiol:disulfide interchange protein n=1 Tax=Jannaschia sp. S6380 TaxID=2926408 RepID=UPI001FF4B780|nr:DsbE family thiol:disulfide interchange protein [Jannaschia sp. S6380]MCK0166130.1 DsbE family thiol:disulfide interchange protein [Jannaschia sp. S6380]